MRIRVKTRSAEYDLWHHNVTVLPKVKSEDTPMEERIAIAKQLSPFKDVQESDDFVVLVALGDLTERPDFFVVPTCEVEQWLQDRWANWVDTPGAKGQQRSPANKQRHLGTDYACKYERYRDAWEQLWGKQLQERPESP